MTEVSYAGWGWWFSIFTISTVAGILLARSMPWSESSRIARVPEMFGATLAPFMVGLATVVALGLLPGMAHAVHLTVVTVLLVILVFVGAVLSRRAGISLYPGKIPGNSGMLWILLWSMLGGWVLFLFRDVLAMPLVQNDALEYATVARLLFETRELTDYPALDPSRGSSGFFGPWTHPPLYTVLGYLAYIAQGHADFPGLMRLVSPWFFLAGAFLVYSTCLTLSPLAAGFAALLYLSAPLALLGSGSAAIDSLPMAGIVMVLACLAFLENRSLARPALLGLAVGLSLWTHSQTILFIPLALIAMVVVDGLGRPADLVRRMGCFFLVVAVLAAWPYGRNVMLFGSMVSDNPAVFAMPELDWTGYFANARGLESWPERIQYGIFKGWSNVDSYGLVFWGMIAGMGLVLFSTRLSVWRDGLLGRGMPRGYRLYGAVFAVVIVYYAGVVLSTLLGIDLMIKNDRYLLVILPCAAVFAGVFLSSLLSTGRWLSEEKSSVFKVVRDIFVLLLTGVLLAQIAGLYFYHYSRNAQMGLSVFGQTQVQKLRYWPGFSAMSYLRENSPPDALVLAQRPAEMYYANRRMISYLDERLVPVYRMQDPAQVAQALRDLGVTHIHMPGYSHPAIYNTKIQDVAARPDLSTMLFSNRSEQIYSLQPSDKRPGMRRDITPGVIPWTQTRSFYPLGLTPLGVEISVEPYTRDQVSVGGVGVPFFQRAMSTALMTGSGAPYQVVQGEADMIEVSPGQEYLIDMTLAGDAYVYVFLYQYNNSGMLLGTQRPSTLLMAEIALDSSNDARKLARRIRMTDETAFIRIALSHLGNTSVQLLRADLTHLE